MPPEKNSPFVHISIESQGSATFKVFHREEAAIGKSLQKIPSRFHKTIHY